MTKALKDQLKAPAGLERALVRGSLCRKASEIDNPAQAKRSTGVEEASSPPQLRRELNSYAVQLGSGPRSYPVLRSACAGLSISDALRHQKHTPTEED
jgi:hypothetical protein